MWISKQTVKSTELPLIQTGKVTMSGQNGVEAVSTSPQRNIEMYSPYGYYYSMPTGDNMLIARCDGNSVSMGVLMEDESLKTGEIKIVSQSGGYIYLKNDGSVVINGLIIDSKGAVRNGSKE